MDATLLGIMKSVARSIPGSAAERAEIAADKAEVAAEVASQHSFGVSIKDTGLYITSIKDGE